jgi:hypothetical protein
MKDNSWNIWNRNLKVSEPACLQKWEWSTIYLEHQNSSSCHRVKKEPFDIETFNFHNTPGVLEARTKMLNGIWPGKGCEYCKDLEDAGGLSDRQHVNNNNKLTYLTPKELEQDNTSVNVTPSTLEVYFSNLCNQACLYCFAKHSSKIESEYRRIDPENGELKFINEKRKNYKQAKNNFWLWMKDNCINLKRYRILGGEPFYQEEIWENINFFKTNLCPELDIQIFTNLNVDTPRVRFILQAFKELIDNNHIKSVRLILSIDAWGPAGEYVRSGLNNKLWKQNFDMLDTEFIKDFSILVHSTLCNLNIKTTVDLTEIFNQSNLSKLNSNFQDFALAGGHDHLYIGNFPIGFFDDDYDLLISKIKNNHVAKSQLNGFKKLTNFKPYRPDLIYKLKDYLDSNDAKRNTNWKQTFPWLDQFNPEDYKE